MEQNDVSPWAQHAPGSWQTAHGQGPGPRMYDTTGLSLSLAPKGSPRVNIPVLMHSSQYPAESGQC